jgi:periplasmic protein TonB
MRPEKRSQSTRVARPNAGHLQPSPHLGLSLALGLSVAVHAGLVCFWFSAPEAYNRVFQDTLLEVVLVNARSQESPQEAQALAQVRLAGGGEVPQARMSSSLLPPAMNADPGMDLSATQKKIEVLKMQQMRLLTQLKDELAVLTRENAGDKADSPDREAKVQRQQQLARQLAQIEPRVDQTQGAARKRYISPATQEVVYAIYYDKMRRTIEYRGTLNFPEAAGEKLYGQLTMVITVDSRGQLLSTEVARSSGQPLLDERAVVIVRNAAPFGDFTPQMRSQADQIVVVARFNFSRDNTLGTQMMAAEQG